MRCDRRRSPDLYEAFGKDRVLKLCQTIHCSEIRQISERLQERFRAFNRDYFDGRLPEYEVRAVYDANFWVKSPTPTEPASGVVDFGLRIIFINQMHEPFMVDALLHHMARLAVGTLDDHGEGWIRGMGRIKASGGPLWSIFDRPSRLKGSAPKSASQSCAHL